MTPAAHDPLAPYRTLREPRYQATGDEFELFEAARAGRLPLLLKGPTGCGKTRFVEHMAWKLGRPLVTVACHEELSAGDLVGRWLLDGEGTRWQDGPLTQAVRHGGLCYLDELIEARADTLVVIHPAGRHAPRAAIGPAQRGVHAHPDFQLIVSYNPAPTAREMKASTRQRFCAIEFAYPAPEQEAGIVAQESGSTSRRPRPSSPSACAPGGCRDSASTTARRHACLSTPRCSWCRASQARKPAGSPSSTH